MSSSVGEEKNELLYETRRHASGAYTPNYPPQQTSETSPGRLFTLVSGVGRLKRIWNDYKEPRKLRRLVSLFISPSGEYVAVAAANRVIILQKGDDFREPCGIFTCSNVCTFKAGAWSEYHDVVGVVDDSNTLYFIKSNGNEMGRIAMKDLKIAQPITGLIAPDDSNVQGSSLCGFTVVTSDGSLQHVEICHDSSSVASSIQISNLRLTPKKLSQDNVICLDYHPKLCWLAVVDNSGCCSSASNGRSGCHFLSLWHKRSSSDLKVLFSIEFDGVFLRPGGYQGQQSYPKVSISQQGAFVATLDVAGDLFIFSLDRDSLAIKPVFFRPEVKEFLRYVVDFTWWSNHIITVSKANGFVVMVDLPHGMVVMENALGSGIPAMEEAGEGKAFFIESTSFSQVRDTSMNNNKQHHEVDELIGYEFDQSKISSLRWNLMSFSERSVHEMYNKLVSNKEYEAAVSFSIRHGLDNDVVLKSQWMHSDNRMKDINDFLMVIQDKEFVLAECMEKVGPTEDDVKALLGYGLSLTDQYVFSDSDNESRPLWDLRMARLKLWQYRDRLETFMGINMGRFSVQEYVRFRETPLYGTAVRLAESGKIGALNLLFKRHLYSLIPFILEILAGIPETVPVQAYGQLLPGANPPQDIALREEDWVECERTVSFINKLPKDIQMAQWIRTEPIVKRCSEYRWPSTDELLSWYQKRALDIDGFTGQLDNCLCLIDMGRSRGISALQPLYEDILYLMQVIYTDDMKDDVNLSLSLSEWERLTDYEKFRIMLNGLELEKVVKILRDKAIPFMRNRLHMTSCNENEYRDHRDVEQKFESFLVRWMKEMALENKLDLCLIVIEEGCKELESTDPFLEEMEAVDCALQCIYLCSSLDKWNVMATLLSKLPLIQGNDGLLGRLILAEAHIEAGRILSFYQVPKPISFFLEAHADEKSVKQIFRLILSKFIRRQLSQSDNDWANMWRDMQFLQEKVFNFLDPEYMLIEFCRGLLKAGKFSLARNYLKGTSVVALASDKAENLVIQAAREYFFSASSLASSEIWKAKECLNLFPGSRSVKAEADIIDAITIRLPSLGVTLLPMQFRQIKDPMEIIRMAITNQPGAYVHVDDLIEVAKLLGLSSKDDISAVEEAIAREAALCGDLQVAFDLCIVLVRKGHGLVWDLCAAIAKGQGLENMDVGSRKLLLGFALSHCDEESINDLLHAWKDLDMQSHCENLMMLTGSTPNLSVPEPFIKSSEVQHEGTDFPDDGGGDEPFSVTSIKSMLSIVARDLLLENGSSWDDIQQNQKILSFAGSYLPWLIKLSRMESSATLDSGLIFGFKYVNSKVFAVMAILSWLVQNRFAPRDDLIISLAKSVLELPGSEEGDILGGSFLLNLVDAFHGVEVIEEQLRKRVNYPEVCSIMNVGMKYGLLNNSGVECKNSAQRRELLHRFFGEKHMPLSSDAMDKFGEVQSSFWREWKIKLEEQKHAADQSRALESIIPGVEAARFLSGDIEYIQNAVYSLIESLKTEKKHVLTNLLKLADSFGVSRAEVLLRFLNSVLTSNMWTNQDITNEIAEVREEIVGFAGHTIDFISRVVYPATNGCRKDQLACLYGLLSDCYARHQGTEESLSGRPKGQAVHSSIGFASFYKLLEQESKRVAFIENLNFKNTVQLDGLNLNSFADEVYRNIDENSIEALANMVRSLVNVYGQMPSEGLISWQDVYKHYVMELLTSLEGKAYVNVESPLTFQELISQIEFTYARCRKYVELLSQSSIFDMIRRFFLLGIPNSGPYWDLRDDAAWQECLIVLISFYIRVTEEMVQIALREGTQVMFQFDVNCLTSCLKLLVKLVMEDTVSPSQGWGIVITCLNSIFLGESPSVLFIFCRGMLLLGCSFVVVSELFSVAAASHGLDAGIDHVGDLVAVYLKILESILQNLPNDVSERRNLCHLFASLSKLEGDLECLKRIRQSVWEKMAAFSDDMMLPSHVRVYALELMQAAIGKPVKGSSVELLPIAPWEEWDPSHGTGANRVTQPILGDSDYCGASGGFTITLVALRSTQILAAISPGFEITPNDLSDADSAASCFVKLCGTSEMESHFDALVSILAEWEGLFVAKKADVERPEASDSADDWGNDEWDEGWESFQEAEPTENENKGDSVSLHPLHTCWTELFKRFLARSSQFKDVLRLLDQYSSKPSGLLLDEGSARHLSDSLIGSDIFTALKMVMLLPYKELQLGCLDAAEDKLKGEGITDEIGRDFNILVLLLHSGLISTIVTQTSYDATFSYVSFLVGYFARRCQESCLSQSTMRAESASSDDRSLLLLFERIVLPAYICHLVKANQQLLAAFIITKFMHTNPSLSLINIAESSLRRYLEGQFQVLRHGEFDVGATSSEQILKNALSSLWEKLGDLIQNALSLISADVR